MGDKQREGESLAMQLSNAMVKAQKQYFGKGPLRAKSYLVDDLLFIVMRGGMTRAEETMLDFDQADMVRDFRQTFENEMTERLTTMIEDITGRKVLTYQSQILFDPNLVIEIFVFDEALDADVGVSASATDEDTD
ncbi:MAG: DUF2294 domain-containing protein [Solirubrobacterales bacterium]|nr:DUF2294 domain-containing protein [Solirubrobacterales bacterium]